MTDQRASKTLAMAAVNDHILRIGRTSIVEEQDYDFFCECGRPDCHEFATLSLAAYAVLRDSGTAVLARGHRVSQVARAQQLTEDARALLAQARHQVNRAKKNLGRDAPRR